MIFAIHHHKKLFQCIVPFYRVVRAMGGYDRDAWCEPHLQASNHFSKTRVVFLCGDIFRVSRLPTD